jgi:hypothetical protein
VRREEAQDEPGERLRRQSGELLCKLTEVKTLRRDTRRRRGAKQADTAAAKWRLQAKIDQGLRRDTLRPHLRAGRWVRREETQDEAGECLRCLPGELLCKLTEVKTLRRNTRRRCGAKRQECGS